MRLLSRISICAVALCAAAAFGQAPEIEHRVEGEQKPWTSDEPRYAPRDFQFVVVSDNTGTPRPGIFREAMEKVELLQPSFVVSVGDLIEGYVDSREELDAQWDEFMAYLEPLSVPFFFAAGNHDVGRHLWHEVYEERIGPTYYYFVYQDVLFLILDSNDGPDRRTGYGDAQLEWAKGVLAEHEDVRWTFALQHKPFWISAPDEWGKVAPMLADRPHTVFAGHIHNYLHTEHQNIQYITMGTTGGGSALRGPALGEFDHVMWVTVTDEGPEMAALKLDGILPANLRTAELAEALRPFRARTAVTATTVMEEGDRFSEGEFEIAVLNPWDKPLRFHGLIEAQPSLEVQPSAIQSMVLPGETFTATVRVSAYDSLAVSEVQPVVLHWSGVYDKFNAPPIRLNDTLRMFVETERKLPVTDGVTVDGDLDDWDELPYVVNQPGAVFTNEQAWKGPQDGRYRFGIARGNEMVYAAIEMFDDAVSTDGTKLWQDFAAIFLRPAVDDEDAGVRVVAGPDMRDEEIADYEGMDEGTSRDRGVTAAITVGDGRLVYEFAVPIELIDVDGDWDRLQVNVGVNDFDPSDARLGVSLITWRPRWDSPAHFPDSGLFVWR